MRVLLIGIGYRGYTETYERALTGIGHEVTTYVGLRQYHWPTRVRRALTVRLPRLVGVRRDYLWSEQTRFRRFLQRGSGRYDLALFVNADRLANDEILEQLRSRASAAGVWLLDDFDTIPRFALDFASFDHRASFNRLEAESLTRALGIRFDYVPQGFAPIVAEAVPASSRPLILGAPYPIRRAAVHSLTGAGIAVEVVGDLWPQWVQPSEAILCTPDVSLGASVGMSGGGRICVNGHRSPDTGVSPRVFEIGGAGGVIVTDGTDVPEFYEPEQEMIHWSDPDELADRVAQLRRDPSRARAMAERAQRRTLAEHTIDSRLRKLLAGWGYE